MRPFLRGGDHIAIEWIGVGFQPPCVGELILGRGDDEQWVVHRVVRKGVNSRNGLLIKGDASFVAENLSVEQVWGRVVGVRRKKTGAETGFSANLLDRCIAFFSRLGIRRMTYVLAVIRRGSG